LGRKVADLEKNWANMAREMERKEKGKVAVVDRLLLGTSIRFTWRVAGYRLPEKFKVPQIQSYTKVGDLIEHLKNFRVHIDLDGKPAKVACRAFPLTLSGNARNWFRKLPSGSVNKFEGLGIEFLVQFYGCVDMKEDFGIFANAFYFSKVR